ncbi:MAG: hypothetical protein E6I26_14560, partial [Chloroflexi bacterium]
MTSTLRRITVTAAAVLLLGLAAVGLVEAGVAIGSNAPRSVPVGSSSSSDDPALAADIDALLAADQTTAPTANAPS